LRRELALFAARFDGEDSAQHVEQRPALDRKVRKLIDQSATRVRDAVGFDDGVVLGE